MRSVSRLMLLGFILLAGAAKAQVPSVSLTGLPATPLIGEQFCVDASFTNTDPSTGYGPYLIAVVDPGIRQISVDFVDIAPQLEKIGDFDASEVLADPISGLVLNGTQGGAAWVARYPIGSVDQGQPPLVMTVCAVVEAGATIGLPLDVQVIPGFEFGDTTVGTNGPITGTAQVSTVTPQLARITKGNSAPESERPPGPSHEYAYQWTVDVSEGVSIENVTISDTLSTDLQWTGAAITVTAPLGVGCAVTSTPSTAPTSGGTATVECTSLLGSASEADLTVTVPVYITDILSGTGPDSQSIANTVDLDFEFEGNSQPTLSDTNTVEAEYATLQKSVSGTGLPGGVLTYALNFQLTDYPDAPAGEGADTFIISDVIPDGLRFDGTVALVINNTIVPITPSVSPGTNPGETSVIWDISAAAGGQVDNGATGSVTYATTILQNYANGSPVLASDGFSNTAELDYALTSNPGATGNNSTTIQTGIQPNVPDKSFYLPNPVPPVLEPGQEVVYELSLSIPAGNTASVVFEDFLPRPVFDVNDFNAANDLEILPPFASLNPTVTTNTSVNSVRMDFGDINTPIATTLRVRLTARIVGTPFADSLFLTNLLATSYENTNGDTISDLQAVGGTIGAPSLTITKGVIAADNPNAVISPTPPADPSTATADSNVGGVDAGDEITFVLTVENVGSTDAYNVTIDDPVANGFSCQAPSPGDIVNGVGNTLGFSGSLVGGIVLDDRLRANDGTVGAPYDRDTALMTLRCTLTSAVEPRQVFTNEAGVTWTSIPDPSSPFARVTDDAEATIADPGIAKSIVAVTPGYSSAAREAHIGELVTYDLVITVPEGTSSAVRVEDVLQSGLAFVEVLSITPSSPDLSTSEGSFADVLSNADFNSQGGGATSPDRRLDIGPTSSDNGFGTVINSNTDNASDETITIRYRARVLNANVNGQGTLRRNRAGWLWQPGGETRRRIEVRAAPVRIIEPQLQLSKLFTPDQGDNSSPPRVTFNFSHRGGSRADAFDMVLADELPDNIFVDGPVDLSGCATPPDNLTVTAAGASDAIQADWANFPRGSSCSISFQTRFGSNPLAGERYENCADLLWESLSGSDQPLPSPPDNTLGVERTGNVADPGERNNYVLLACDVFTIFDVGIAKNLIATDQAHTDNIAGTPPGFESLTIGETATFELVLTIPDADITELRVSDLLPTTSNVLELISASTTFVGSDLSVAVPNPVATISDSERDGINDQAELNYGSVIQAADGSTDDDDRIRIQVVAKVRDVLVNDNDDRTDNNAVARFDGLTASDTFGLEIVEPLLDIDKSADFSEAEAGDSVTYTLRIQHTAASRIDAKDLTLSDVIPAELNVVPGSVDLGDVCTEPPSSGPTLAGGIITASWDTFPRSDVCEIEFQAVVDISAVIGQRIVNETDINWTSLDSTGDPDDRSYDLSDRWVLGITEPGLNKQLTASDVAVTRFTLGDPGAELTIGETATFTVTADFSDGTTENVLLRDQLPTNDVALQITGSRIVSIGSDLSLSSGALVGDAGADCTGGGTQTCADWDLGTVVNAPDLRPEPDPEDSIVFEIDAIVLDDPLNSGAPGEDKNLVNTATLTASGVSLTALEVFDIVEPQLQLNKLGENGELPTIIGAGDIRRFTLELSHAGISTATAVEVQVTDSLDPSILWVDDSTASSDCPGFAVDSSPGAGNSGSAVFTVSQLSLLDGVCSIAYDVQAIAGLVIPGNYPNTADLEWYSAPLPNAESRQGTDSDRNGLNSVSNAILRKIIFGTSVPDTRTGIGDPLIRDVAIGERISYRIVSAFDEGVTNGVVLTDTLEATDPNDPELELLGGGVVFVGNNISTSNTGDPVAGPSNVVTVDYGTVTNTPPDGLDLNDTIVYELIAQVTDISANVSGNLLTNEVELTFAGATMPVTASADVEIVEPVLTVTKTFTDLTEGVATIEIVLRNTGNSSGYETGFTDAFDETYWLPGTLNTITLPEGFTLTEASAGGTTTVSLATEGDPSKPEEVLSPNETITVVFTMELVNKGIVNVPQIVNTVNATTTSLPGVDAAERTYTADDNDTLRFPILALEKTWSGPNNPAQPGDTITYSLALENTGGGPATAIEISDDLTTNIGEFVAGSVSASTGGTVVTGNTPGDTGVQATYSSLAASATATVTFEVLVPTPYPDGMTSPEELENQAAADSKEQQGILSDDPTSVADPNDPTIVPVVADPIMTVSKNDQVALTSPGEVIEYRIDYGNVGNQNATGVSITETVPANTVFSAARSTGSWSCPDGSAAGTTCTLNIGALAVGSGSAIFAVVVENPLPAGVTQINNTVAITDDGVEFDPGAPVIPSTGTDSETTPLSGAFPQLRVEKDDGGIGVTPGQRYSYLIDYRNIGNQDATGVVITETVPDDVFYSATASTPTTWSCPDGSPSGTICSVTVPLLLAGTSDQARFGLDVIFPAEVGSEIIVNTVDIEDDGANSLLPSTDTDSDSTPLIAAPDLFVTKAADVTQTDRGQTIVYTLLYGNAGNQNSSSSLLREIVPVATSFNESESLPSVWSCPDAAAEGTACELPTGRLNVGDGGSQTFTVNVVAVPPNREIANEVQIQQDQLGIDAQDPNIDDNTDFALTPFPTLSIDTMGRSALFLLALMTLLLGARKRKLLKEP